MPKSDWKKFQREALEIAITIAGNQNELARALDVSRQEISRWKTCTVKMSIGILLELEQFVAKGKKSGTK